MFAKRLPPELRPALESFRRVVAHVEGATSSLTDAVPTTRLPGRPLAEALMDFEDGLRAAAREMPGWRADDLEDVWRACDEAIARTLADAERLRLEAEPPAGFEALIGTIGDLIAPLDAFGAAADRFRALRSRR